MAFSERLLLARHLLRSLRPWWRRLLAFCAVMVVVFAGVGWLQHEYIRTSFFHGVDRELTEWATSVVREVAYKDKWDLTDYRERSNVDAPRWWIISRDGLIVDLTGLEPKIFNHVRMVRDIKTGSPTTVGTSIGESWRVLSRNIDGGVVVVATVSPSDVANADIKLTANLDKFGTNLARAEGVRERETDQEVDYAVIATGGALVNASGGVPLIVDVRNLPVALDAGSAATLTDAARSYRLLSLPIRGTDHQVVGAVVVPREITAELQALADQDHFNIALVGGSLALLVLTVLGFAVRESLRRRECPTVEEALRVGESKTVEFKSTYQWDPDKGTALPDKRIVILKAITGFLNADGGTLYIGVAEDNSTKRPCVCGLEKDLELMSGNVDKLRRDLVHLIASRVGTQFAPFIADHVEAIGKNVCWIVCVQRGPEPAFVKWQDWKKFYVREGPRTADLDNESTWHYIKNRWG